MALGSKLQIENIGSLASIAFYAIAGVLLLVFLALSGFPPHIGLMGITSLITAYGLFRKRSWAIWMVAALFFVATAFSLYTLYYVLATDALASAGMIAYAVLTWIFTAYAFSKRKAD